MRIHRFDLLLEKIIEHPIFSLAALAGAVSLAVLGWAHARDVELAGVGLVAAWVFALVLWRIGR